MEILLMRRLIMKNKQKKNHDSLEEKKKQAQGINIEPQTEPNEKEPLK